MSNTLRSLDLHQTTTVRLLRSNATCWSGHQGGRQRSVSGMWPVPSAAVTRESVSGVRTANQLVSRQSRQVLSATTPNENSSRGKTYNYPRDRFWRAENLFHDRTPKETPFKTARLLSSAATRNKHRLSNGSADSAER